MSSVRSPSPSQSVTVNSDERATSSSAPPTTTASTTQHDALSGVHPGVLHHPPPRPAWARNLGDMEAWEPEPVMYAATAAEAEYFAAFDAWAATPEASTGMEYGINFQYPAALTTRLEAVRPRRPPYLYDVQGVKKETGTYFHVRRKGRYALRSWRPLIPVEQLCPKPCDRDVRAPRDGSMTMHYTLDGSVADDKVLKSYYDVIDALPDTYVADGVVGTGLFLGDDVEGGDYIVEYTGNRVDAKSSIAMNDAMDILGINTDRLVNVPSERSRIDPRGCGNIAMCVNHRCVPNAQLVEVGFGKHTVVMIRTLVSLSAGAEVTIDYGYRSLMSHSILICDCKHPKCRGVI